jgi:hypothetical protein
MLRDVAMRLHRLALLPLLALHACTCLPDSQNGASCAPAAYELEGGATIDTCTPGGGECTQGLTYACANGQQISSSLECPLLFQSCCVPNGPPDDATVTDASTFGLCNGSECAPGCVCSPPGECRCDDADAGDAESNVDSDSDTDVAVADAETDAEFDADIDADAGTAACGVITCLTGCDCVDVQSSECVCP